MKSIFLLAAGLLSWPLFTSCTEYGAYGYNSGYSSGGYSSGGYVGSDYGYSSGYSTRSYAPLQVGFIATSYDRWAYDPYRRCYFDRSVSRYYNHGSKHYYTSAPRRWSVPQYPHGYRRGHRLAAPSYLPRHSHSDHRRTVDRSRSSDRYHGSTGSRYADSNRGSRGNSGRSSGGDSRLRTQPSIQPRTRTVPPRQVTRPTRRMETIRTTPTPPVVNRRTITSRNPVVTRTQPTRSRTSSNRPTSRPTPSVVRSRPSAPAVRSQPTPTPAPSRARPESRRSDSSRSSSSRGSSSSSRSTGRARQRTR